MRLYFEKKKIIRFQKKSKNKPAAPLKDGIEESEEIFWKTKQSSSSSSSNDLRKNKSDSIHGKKSIKSSTLSKTSKSYEKMLSKSKSSSIETTNEDSKFKQLVDKYKNLIKTSDKTDHSSHSEDTKKVKTPKDEFNSSSSQENCSKGSQTMQNRQEFFAEESMSQRIMIDPNAAFVIEKIKKIRFEYLKQKHWICSEE